VNLSPSARRGTIVGVSLALAGSLVACSVAGSSATPSMSGRAPSASATASPTCSQAARLSTWTTQQLAAQVLAAPALFNKLAAAAPLAKAGFGGIILFGTTTPKNLGAQVSGLLTLAPGVTPVVMADEEGGTVQRMQAVVGYLPSARYMTKTMTAAQIKARATSVGRSMASVHVLMNLAPVLDVDNRPGPNASNPDGTRSFSGVPAIAAKNGAAFAQGLRSGGVISVGKHFPGLGGSVGNTDVGPGHTLPWSTLQRTALIPFKIAIADGIPVIMVANATVPGLTSLPASISPTVMKTVLRQQLGFRGVIITDSLSAGALRKAGYPLNKAIVASLAAGADFALFGTGSTTGSSIALQARDAVVAAVKTGTLSRARLIEATTRILAMKRVNLCAR
jgi:beta-N-acetylhexosaminidase